MICQLRGIGFSAGGRKILEDVDLDLERGCLTVIAGPNGSGKSTLLRIAAGLLRPHSGTVLAGEKKEDLFSMNPERAARFRAYAPQDTPSVSFSLFEFVSLGRLPWRGEQPAQTRSVVTAALHLVGIESLLDQSVSSLSGGERQRGSIARVLAQTPELAFLDEPVSAQDWGHAVQMADLFAGLCRRGLSLCMVTHDLNLAAMYADRILLLANGRKIAFGLPEDILQSDLLSSVYDCRITVDRHPETHVLRVFPVGKCAQ
ncbi:MAG: ABC transporter ATP-binding protein [Desulfovibrionaceae bacterium]|nr:ABC transporter ATP-binding protein [Desulfovibrionaceae bacterium]